MEVYNSRRVELFYKKINKNGPTWYGAGTNLREDLKKCWIWEGAKDKDGYGNFTVGRKKTGKAHRFSFLLKWGWILPHPYQIDHQCNNTSCVNPYHLLLLHGKTNNYKSNSPSAINKRKTHCCKGHKFSENNTLHKNGRRICLECVDERKNKYDKPICKR